MDSSSPASVLPGSSDDRIIGEYEAKVAREEAEKTSSRGVGGVWYNGVKGIWLLRRDGTYDATRSYRDKNGT